MLVHLMQGRMQWLNNDLVNMIQISLAALIAIGANYAKHS